MASKFLTVVALAASVTARPSNLSYDKNKIADQVVRKSTIDQDGPPYLLDDMRFFQGQHEELKSGLTNDQYHWPSGQVRFVIDSSLAEQQQLIYDAMSHIESMTCIRFTELTFPSGNYINILAGNGCYSFFGMSGGKQPLSLGNGCLYKGVIIHEILHAIGCYHEQSRSDRDNYIKVNYDNIQDGQKSQFYKVNEGYASVFGTSYDYNSIMHYGSYAFSKNNQPTMIATKKSAPPLLEPYHKEAMTENDAQLVNKMYNNCVP